MSIPIQKKITLPILDLLKDGKSLHVDKIEKKLADDFKLNREEKHLKKSSGNEGLFHNRIRWAVFYLRKAGLIESISDSLGVDPFLILGDMENNPKLMDFFAIPFG